MKLKLPVCAGRFCPSKTVSRKGIEIPRVSPTRSSETFWVIHLVKTQHTATSIGMWFRRYSDEITKLEPSQWKNIIGFTYWIAVILDHLWKSSSVLKGLTLRFSIISYVLDNKGAFTPQLTIDYCLWKTKRCQLKFSLKNKSNKIWTDTAM